MDKLVAFQTENGHTVYIETTEIEPAGGLQQVSLHAGDVIDNTVKSLSDALAPVKSISQSLYNTFKSFDHAPDEIAVELSVKLTAEAGVVITKAAVEGNFKISLTWKKAKA